MEPFAWLSCPDPKLAEALVYLAQHPGKQLRSRLTISSAQLVAGESVPAAVMAGEAIELLHTYSLVHDDLPMFDDADLRSDAGIPWTVVLLVDGNIQPDRLFGRRHDPRAPRRRRRRVNGVVLANLVLVLVQVLRVLAK